MPKSGRYFARKRRRNQSPQQNLKIEPLLIYESDNSNEEDQFVPIVILSDSDVNLSPPPTPPANIPKEENSLSIPTPTSNIPIINLISDDSENEAHKPLRIGETSVVCRLCKFKFPAQFDEVATRAHVSAMHAPEFQRSLNERSISLKEFVKNLRVTRMRGTRRKEEVPRQISGKSSKRGMKRNFLEYVRGLGL